MNKIGYVLYNRSKGKYLKTKAGALTYDLEGAESFATVERAFTYRNVWPALEDYIVVAHKISGREL